MHDVPLQAVTAIRDQRPLAWMEQEIAEREANGGVRRIAADAKPAAMAVDVPLGRIVLGVFLGMWAFGATAGIVYAVIHAALQP